mmetsp:Transcript_85930/g.191243  ORF Transcript_85930/g.191243 Transcript_85930/m.191243 type:complete len:823 (-) Transcript_85930:68-2536(-)
MADESPCPLQGEELSPPPFVDGVDGGGVADNQPLTVAAGAQRSPRMSFCSADGEGGGETTRAPAWAAVARRVQAEERARESAISELTSFVHQAVAGLAARIEAVQALAEGAVAAAAAAAMDATRAREAEADAATARDGDEGQEGQDASSPLGAGNREKLPGVPEEECGAGEDGEEAAPYQHQQVQVSEAALRALAEQVGEALQTQSRALTDHVAEALQAHSGQVQRATASLQQWDREIGERLEDLEQQFGGRLGRLEEGQRQLGAAMTDLAQEATRRAQELGDVVTNLSQDVSAVRAIHGDSSPQSRGAVVAPPRQASAGSIENSPVSTPRSLPTARPSQLAAMLPLVAKAAAQSAPSQAADGEMQKTSRSASPSPPTIGPPATDRAAAIAAAAAAAAAARMATTVPSWTPPSMAPASTSSYISEPPSGAAMGGTGRSSGATRGRRLPPGGRNLVISAAGAMTVSAADISGGFPGSGSASQGQPMASSRAAYAMPSPVAGAATGQRAAACPGGSINASAAGNAPQQSRALAGGRGTWSAPSLLPVGMPQPASPQSWEQRSRSPSPVPGAAPMPAGAQSGSNQAWQPVPALPGPSGRSPRVTSPPPSGYRAVSPGAGGFAGASPRHAMPQAPLSPHAAKQQQQGAQHLSFQPRLSAPPAVAGDHKTMVASPRMPESSSLVEYRAMPVGMAPETAGTAGTAQAVWPRLSQARPAAPVASLPQERRTAAPPTVAAEARNLTAALPPAAVPSPRVPGTTAPAGLSATAMQGLAATVPSSSPSSAAPRPAATAAAVAKAAAATAAAVAAATAATAAAGKRARDTEAV